MKKRRILFDAGPMLDNQKTGVGYYTRHLAESLQFNHEDSVDLVGYYFNFLNRNGNKEPAGSILKFHKIWLVPGKLLSLCRRLGFQPFLELFVRKRFDTIIYTNYVALPQLRKRKTALVVYDLGFLDAPEFVQETNLKYLRRFCPPSIRRADIIITISEFTKSRILHYFPDLKSEIVVTPVPAPDKPERQPLTKDLVGLGVHEKKYILYVGTVEPRKNLETLVTAYAQLNADIRAKHALVIAGGKGWKDEAILAAVAEQQAKGENIILTGYVSDEDKQALYSNAACFALPSHYEGFGMPILEAMQYGCPVALSDIPVFHEVAGEAAVYFDKDSSRDIASKLASLLKDPAGNEKLARKAARHLMGFSWEDNAEKVYRAL